MGFSQSLSINKMLKGEFHHFYTTKKRVHCPSPDFFFFMSVTYPADINKGTVVKGVMLLIC